MALQHVEILAVGTQGHIERVCSLGEFEGAAVRIQQAQAAVTGDAIARDGSVTGIGDVGVLVGKRRTVGVRHPAGGAAEIHERPGDHADYAGGRNVIRGSAAERLLGNDEVPGVVKGESERTRPGRILHQRPGGAAVGAHGEGINLAGLYFRNHQQGPVRVKADLRRGRRGCAQRPRRIRDRLQHARKPNVKSIDVGGTASSIQHIQEVAEYRQALGKGSVGFHLLKEDQLPGLGDREHGNLIAARIDDI